MWSESHRTTQIALVMPEGGPSGGTSFSALTQIAATIPLMERFIQPSLLIMGSPPLNRTGVGAAGGENGGPLWATSEGDSPLAQQRGRGGPERGTCNLHWSTKHNTSGRSLSLTLHHGHQVIWPEPVPEAMMKTITPRRRLL